MKLSHGMCFASVAMLATLANPALGASTAFRLTDLDLRDPHIFVNFLGCRDVTDTQLVGYSFNSDTQTRIQTDGDSDGFLDLSHLIVFDPLDQSGAGGAMRFGTSSCTAPLGSTACGPPELLVDMTAVNGSVGPCLGTLPATLHPYSPAVIGPSAPCFVSNETVLNLDLGGMFFTLRSARIAATYSGSPASQLVNGLIRGFLTQADADNTILPASSPLVGGMPLSSLLPGGDPPGPNNTNCAPYSDKDLGPDGVTQGWWMYFNFVASPVPYTGPQLSVDERAEHPGELSASPNPSWSSVTVNCWLVREGFARVAVYDLSGRQVAELASGRLPAGSHRLTWDGRRAGEGRASPGLYMIKLSSDGSSVAKRVVLLR